MNTYQIFRAGNSDVVALNPVLRQKHGFDLGVRVVQEDTKEGILIKSASKKVDVSPEFKKWLNKTAKKYAPALRELAGK